MITYFNLSTLLLHSCLSTLSSYLYDAQLLRLLECPIVPQIKFATCALFCLQPIQFFLFFNFLTWYEFILGKFAWFEVGVMDLRYTTKTLALIPLATHMAWAMWPWVKERNHFPQRSYLKIKGQVHHLWLRRAWWLLQSKVWVTPHSKPPKPTEVPAEAKNLEWVVDEGDDISCSPETKGSGGGYRTSYKPYCSKFPQEVNSIKIMEESFADGVNLLYKASGSEQAQMVDSSTPFQNWGTHCPDASYIVWWESTVESLLRDYPQLQ